jgi:hypothetical protein
MGGGAMLLLAASSDGSVARLRMEVPTQPGSRPEDIQLRGEDFDGALLLPWLDAHAAAVAALSANTGVVGMGVGAWRLDAKRAGPCLQRAPQLSVPPLISCMPFVSAAVRRELLTAAVDGSLALHPLAAEDSSSSSALYSSGGAVTFSAARWNGPHTAVTGSLQGG